MISNDRYPVPQLVPQAAVESPASEPKPAKPLQPRDSVREVIETVVFVTVLVLLLKCFVAEAFVIPTGSMAETLLGYQKFATCPECGHVFPVNCTDEVEPQNGGPPRPVEACTCPNCRYHDVWRNGNAWVKERPDWGSGDRVLVSKSPFHKFQRFDVVVFKYPKSPQQAFTPTNYIKRLMGLPGETIAIFNGDIYVASKPIEYPPDRCPQPAREEDRWQSQYMYKNDPAAINAFKQGDFKIVQKPPEQILSMRRLVYDNDHQAKDLVGKVPPRWQPEAGWKQNDDKKPTEFHNDVSLANDGWVHYQHLTVRHGADLPPPAGPFAPELIKNMMGYNWADPPRNRDEEDKYWVGDLSVDCNVDVTQAAGEFILELSRGRHRYQARFDLATGVCRLMDKDIETKQLGEAPTALKGGKHFVRFANVDERLTVWVDGTLPFGDGVPYSSAKSGEIDDVNDKQPASIGVHGDARVTVKNIQLYRDTYYTGEVGGFSGDGPLVTTRYVQPGHFLCLGDNSTQSSDGRDWGTVPERLMLGQAKVIYFPMWPIGANRAGAIR